MQEGLSRRAFLGTTAMATGALIGSIGRASAQSADRPAVELKDDCTVLDIKVGSKPFAVYNYNSAHAGLYRPFFHPLMGPNDRPITQNGEFPGTLRGHYWHRALFIAHQKVNGVSFWEERQTDCGRMVHLGFDEVISGSSGRFVQRLAWRDLKGEDLLHETRTVEIPNSDTSRRFLSIVIRLKAVRAHITFAVTPYNLLACRVTNALCQLKEKQEYTTKFGPLVDFSPLDQGGRITNSEGKQGDACRGARAQWCDFSGPLGDGTWGGIAILDHPSNPRYPTPWHNWNNMTITASFTFHEPFKLKKGGELGLRYLVLVHAGDAKQADVGEVWKAFAQWAPA